MQITETKVFEVLRLLCGEYTEDNDNCDKIIHETPKSKLNANNLPKSVIGSYIDIFNSIKEY